MASLAGMHESDLLNQNAQSMAEKKTGYGIIKDNETVFKRGEVIIPTKASRERSKSVEDSSTDNDSENRITAEEINELNQQQRLMTSKLSNRMQNSTFYGFKDL